MPVLPTPSSTPISRGHQTTLTSTGQATAPQAPDKKRKTGGKKSKGISKKARQLAQAQAKSAQVHSFYVNYVNRCKDSFGAKAWTPLLSQLKEAKREAKTPDKLVVYEGAFVNAVEKIKEENKEQQPAVANEVARRKSSVVSLRKKSDAAGVITTSTNTAVRSLGPLPSVPASNCSPKLGSGNDLSCLLYCLTTSLDTIKSLTLVGMELSDHSIILLSKCLSSSQTIARLDLSRTRLFFAKEQQSLQSHLLQAIEQNTSLRGLILDYNQLPASFTLGVFHSLKRNLDLNFEHNSLALSPSSNSAGAAVSPIGLKIFSFKYCHLTKEESILALSLWLSHPHCQIKEIDLTGNRIGARGLKRLLMESTPPLSLSRLVLVDIWGMYSNDNNNSNNSSGEDGTPVIANILIDFVEQTANDSILGWIDVRGNLLKRIDYELLVDWSIGRKAKGSYVGPSLLLPERNMPTALCKKQLGLNKYFNKKQKALAKKKKSKKPKLVV